MPAPSTTAPSWSDMARLHRPEEKKKVFEELNKLKYHPPVPSQNNAQKSFNFRQVTVRGLAERPISEIKSSLYTIRIRLGKIRNIGKVGKNTYEFLVEADYMRGFMKRMEHYGYSPMDNYDPLTPREDDAAQETKDRIMSAGVTRIAKTIMTTKVDAVKRFYETYAVERRIMDKVLLRTEQLREENAHPTSSATIDSVFEELNQMIPDEPMPASPTGEASV